MNTRNVGAEWLNLWRQLSDHADALHDSQSVAFGLLDAYDQLSAEEKSEVHSILGEWLLSRDNRRRYDARFLVTERQIRELAPSATLAIDRLNCVAGPEARDEVELLQKLREDLAR